MIMYTCIPIKHVMSGIDQDYMFWIYTYFSLRKRQKDASSYRSLTVTLAD